MPDEYSYYTSIIEGVTNKTHLLEFDMALHAWLTTHNGDISGFPGIWWTNKTPPFNCYSKPELEHQIVIFNTDNPLMAPTEFRVVDYPMGVTKISASGLRFKVFENMWVLAGTTQEKP